MNNNEIILAIDTTLGSLNLALYNNNKISERRYDIKNQQSKLISVEVESLLNEAGCTIDEVNTILVTRGPGSFTGIRIGLAFAEGILMGKKDVKIFTCTSMPFLDGDNAHGLVSVRAGLDSYFIQLYNYGSPASDINMVETAQLQSMAVNTVVCGHFNDPHLMISPSKIIASYNKLESRHKFFDTTRAPLYINDTYY